jgi:hypothetical protein
MILLQSLFKVGLTYSIPFPASMTSLNEYNFNPKALTLLASS